MTRRVMAVVPAYDAEATIGATLDALAGEALIDETVVIDDGSTDDTSTIAEGRGVRTIRHAENLGKGAAMASGVGAADSGVAAIAFVDADLGATAAGLTPILATSTERPEAMVVAVPVAAGARGGFGLVRDLASEAIATATGARVRSPLSGQRVVPLPLAGELVYADRFGVETAMTIDAARRGVELVEVDVEVDHHHHGRSWAGFAHRARQGYDIVRALVPRLGPVTVVRLVVLVGFRAVVRLVTGRPSGPQ